MYVISESVANTLGFARTAPHVFRKRNVVKGMACGRTATLVRLREAKEVTAIMSLLFRPVESSTRSRLNEFVYINRG